LKNSLANKENKNNFSFIRTQLKPSYSDGFFFSFSLKIILTQEQIITVNVVI
jgi:hypothetical protein